MIKNFFLVTIRNIFRNKAFSIINILGLSLGMACSILIFLWVHDEQRVDKFLTGNKAVYGVYERVFSEGKVEAGHNTPGLLATELKRNIPEIKYASGFWSAEEILFSAGNKNINEKGCYTDSDFFKIFNYHLLQGTKATALTGPDDIALSKKMAVAFFGSPEKAIGKTIRFNNLIDFRVSAVFDDQPSYASEKFDYALNWQYLLKSVTWLKDWINRSPATYIELKNGADPIKTEAKIKDFIKPYLGSYAGGYHLELGLQRFDQMYLNATFKNGLPAGGRIEYVRLFSIIAIFILLIACINFMNLATARSVKRSKEVGIRKAIGAIRGWLILQFIGEAVLLAFFALIAAISLVALILPVFNQITAKQIVLPFSSVKFWLCSSGLLLLTGIVAGSYPALFLSSLNPVKVLKGSLKFSPGALFFRKGLVVFQFVLSIIFIVSTIVIAQQIKYVQAKSLGFDKENLVYIPIERDLGRKFSVFKQQLSSLPGIRTVTYSNQIPTQTGAHVYNLDWEGKNPATKVVAIHNGVGYDYLKTMNLKLLMGRDFSRDFPSDSTAYIINETALKMTGYKNLIGKRLTFFEHRGKIIGVLKDFNFQSLHNPIQPLVIAFTGENISWDGGYTIVRTEAGKTKAAIASMGSVFKEMEPEFPFRYFFADEEYQKLYNNEQAISKLSDSFSFLAIFLSCLGLLGLAMFTAEQRAKEIGVRKIIGANVSDIVLMLSSDIVRLVIIASVIATPVSWLVLNKWLQGFAFRIQISWWTFIVAGVLTLLIAMLTISYQAIKAAFINPIKSLRSE
jgi:putative ABC transport system permease protein